MPQLNVIEKIATGYGLQVWQMFVPNFDPSNPPLISQQTEAERDLYNKLKSAFDAVSQHKG